MYEKKKKTREELEMMKNGLTNVFNLPMTDHTEIMNYKDCRRTLKEIIEGIHNKPMSKNLRKSRFKWNIPEIEMQNKKISDNINEGGTINFFD